MRRAPIIPVRPKRQDKQTKVSPKGLAARLHEQAGKLLLNTAAPENEDVLVLSDDDSNQDAADEDAVLADATLSLVRILQVSRYVCMPAGSACTLTISAAASNGFSRSFFPVHKLEAKQQRLKSQVQESRSCHHRQCTVFTSLDRGSCSGCNAHRCQMGSNKLQIPLSLHSSVMLAAETCKAGGSTAQDSAATSEQAGPACGRCRQCPSRGHPGTHTIIPSPDWGRTILHWMSILVAALTASASLCISHSSHSTLLLSLQWQYCHQALFDAEQDMALNPVISLARD